MAGCGRGGGRGTRGRKRKQSDDGWGGWGGYMNAKIEKLGKQSSPQKKVSDIFKGISIFINGYTKPPQDELKKLVLENGGDYQHYYSRSRVTHIIASSLAQSKITQIRNQTIVKPEWITESLMARRLLPCRSYLLHDQKAIGVNTGLLTSMRSGDSASIMSVAFDSTHNVLEESQLENNSKIESVDISDKNGDDFLPCQDSDDPGSIENNNQQPSVGDDGKINSSICGNSVNSTSCPEPATSTKQSLPSVCKAGDPGFISEFYNHSRLHHLSTWGAEFKSYVTSLQQQVDVSFPGRDRLRQIVAQRNQELNSVQHSVKTDVSGCRQRAIMHIDMDCFFVSVALRNRTELKGHPVAVTHSKGKGPANSEEVLEMERAYWSGGTKDLETSTSKNSENTSKQMLQSSKDARIYYSMAEIASCSYEARQAGVKNGMLFGKAKKLCPELIPVPYNFEAYKEVSQHLYDTVGSYTLEIEAVSCDELYVDCSDVVADTGASALEFADLLRQEILEKTGCTASAGIGGNMLLARLATKAAKPNGQFLVEPDLVSDFMKNKLVSELPGVGHVMSSKLEALSVKTCGDLMAFSIAALQKHFGQKTGQMLYRYARGEDDRTLKMSVERKSVSAEINYGMRFTNMSDVERFVRELSGEVQNRLKAIGKKGRTITLKLKVRQDGAPQTTAKFMGHGICDSTCKSTTLPVATESSEIIAQECCALLKQMKVVNAEDIRGIGIQMTFLESTSGQASVSGCRSILDFAAPLTRENCPDESQSSTKTIKLKPPAVLPEDHSNVVVADKICVIKKPSEAESLPPLPSLGSLNLSFEERKEDFDARSISEATRKDASFFPSLSQIDERVLSELPEDIQAEIKEALRKRTSEFVRKEYRTDSTDSRRGSQVEELKPGCSHWTSSDATTEHSSLNTLPPYSQLDASCFGALPPELQEEIMQVYASDLKKQNLAPQEAEEKLHPLMRDDIRNSLKLSPAKTSPGKRSSPKKSPQKKSPSSFKVPTGKPPGRRKNSTKRQIRFPTTTVLREQRKSLQTSDNVLNEESGDFEQTSDKQSIGRSANLCSNAVNCTNSICLDDLKRLFRHWIMSSVAPNDDNLTMFLQYFMKLIQCCDLERVGILLRFVNRISHDENLSTEWKKGSHWLINQVQGVVRSLYGGPIKLPEY